MSLRGLAGLGALGRASTGGGGAVRGIPTNMGSLRAFPGAEGYGADMVPAARQASRTIEYVTNLNDSGAGSLRAAMAVSGPKVIIFETSGQLVASSGLGDQTAEWADGDTFIVGQSAPSPGISIEWSASSGELFTTKANRLVVQHLKFRPLAFTNPTGDTFNFTGAGGVFTDQILDHCSIYWAGDELVVFAGEIDKATLSNCLIAQPLEVGGKSVLVGSGATNCASIRNLFCHTGNRTPELMNDGCELTSVNNFMYNHNQLAGRSYGTGGTLATYFNMIGSTWKAGPETPGSGPMTINLVDHGAGPGSIMYHSDLDLSASGWSINDTQEGWTVRTDTPAFALPTLLTLLSRTQVETHLIANVGARPLDRDSLDQEMIDDVSNATGNTTTEAGTPPTLAVNTRDWSSELTSDPWGTDAEGWTNLEREIHDKMTLVVQPTPLGL